jgi:hypothetical protein
VNVTENVRVIDSMLKGSPATTELTDKETAYLVAFIARWAPELPDAVVQWGKTASDHLGDLSAYFPNSRSSTRAQEVKTLSAETKIRPSAVKVEAGNHPGVYAYSYPSLIAAASFRDAAPLIKIGASSNVEARISTQYSRTEVPENLVLLWAFDAPTTEDAFLLETNIHALLRLFGKWRKTAESGSEWFEVSVPTLESLVKIIVGDAE